MNDPLLTQLCAVTGRRQESSDVFTLDIEPPGGYQPFHSGQFNMLYVPGAGESAISISGDPANTGSLTHTIRAVGNVTHLLSRLCEGDLVGLRGPFGRPWPLDNASGQDLVLIAGGIGMAPLRPVLYAVLADRDRFGRVSVLYGARTPADILYSDQLRSWKREGKIELAVSVDFADESWIGDVGVITGQIPRLKLDPDNSIVMICGPEIMMRYSINILREMAVKNESIYVSLERNMACGTGYCGHCQLGPYFLCKDGPVFCYNDVESLLMVKEF